MIVGMYMNMFGRFSPATQRYSKFKPEAWPCVCCGFNGPTTFQVRIHNLLQYGSELTYQLEAMTGLCRDFGIETSIVATPDGYEYQISGGNYDPFDSIVEMFKAIQKNDWRFISPVKEVTND